MVSRPLDSVLQWGCELSSKDDLTLRERGVMAGSRPVRTGMVGVHSEGAGGSYCPEKQAGEGKGRETEVGISGWIQVDRATS